MIATGLGVVINDVTKFFKSTIRRYKLCTFNMSIHDVYSIFEIKSAAILFREILYTHSKLSTIRLQNYSIASKKPSTKGPLEL